MLSVKQGSIKYLFFFLFLFFFFFLYNSTWYWTPVFRAIGEYSTHKANGLVCDVLTANTENKLVNSQMIDIKSWVYEE